MLKFRSVIFGDIKYSLSECNTKVATSILISTTSPKKLLAQMFICFIEIGICQMQLNPITFQPPYEFFIRVIKINTLADCRLHFLHNCLDFLTIIT